VCAIIERRMGCARSCHLRLPIHVLPLHAQWQRGSQAAAALKSSQVLTNVPCCVGVANLMLDILAQLHSGNDLGSQHSGPSSLLLLGPPGVGESMMRCTTC
jgi:hypothetical protein